MRSDLKLPDQVFPALSIFLMLSIGLQGGAKLADRPLAELALPMAGALALGCVIPLWCYALLRRFAGLGIADAAALAAHYGSVSAVTFAAVGQFLTRQGIPFEGYAPALLAIREVPAIVIAIGLAGVASMASRSIEVNAGGSALIGSPTTTWSSSAVGLSYGGAVILGTLAASASYIVAPAAVRLALPDANPGYYLTCSLAITFPFNIVAGIPLYSAMARFIY